MCVIKQQNSLFLVQYDLIADVSNNIILYSSPVSRLKIMWRIKFVTSAFYNKGLCCKVGIIFSRGPIFVVSTKIELTKIMLKIAYI